MKKNEWARGSELIAPEEDDDTQKQTCLMRKNSKLYRIFFGNRIKSVYVFGIFNPVSFKLGSFKKTPQKYVILRF